MNSYTRALKFIHKYNSMGLYDNDNRLIVSRQCGKQSAIMELTYDYYMSLIVIKYYRRASYGKYKNKKGVR